MAALFLAAAVILGLVPSFSYLAAAAVGLGFVAAALISAARRSPTARMPALLALLRMALAVFGTVTTSPFLYLGFGLIAGGATIAVLFALSARARRGYAELLAAAVLALGGLLMVRRDRLVEKRR